MAALRDDLEQIATLPSVAQAQEGVSELAEGILRELHTSGLL
jgi:hypothetical protein